MDLPTKTIGIRLPIDEDEINAKKEKKKSKRGGKSAAPKPPLKAIYLDDAKIFEPTLQVIPGKGKVINDLRKSASTAEAVYLAGDPDREGEAISAHLAMVLSKPTKFLIPDDEEDSKNGKKDAEKEAKEAEAAAGKKGKGKFPKKAAEKDKMNIAPIDPKKIFRVTFNEITPKAIRA